jgi:hypothetical protein
MTRYQPPLPMPPWPKGIFASSQHWLNLIDPPNNSSNINIQMMPGACLSPPSDQCLILVFWDASCSHCVQEIPVLNELNRLSRMGLPFQVLGIHVPEYPFGESLDWLKNQISRLNVQYPVFMDHERLLWKRLEPSGWPHWFLISGERTLHLSVGGVGTALDVCQLLLTLYPETLTSQQALSLKTLEAELNTGASLRDRQLSQCASEVYFPQNPKQSPSLNGNPLTIPFQGWGVQLVGESRLPNHQPIWVECQLLPENDFQQPQSQTGFWLAEPRLYEVFQFSEWFQGEIQLRFPESGHSPPYQLYNMTFMPEPHVSYRRWNSASGFSPLPENLDKI